MLTLLKPGIEDYAHSKSGALDPLLDELWDETHKVMSLPQMLTGRLEGGFLKMIVQLINAKNVLEIGTFTGYSALAMAEGLPDNGTISTLEIDPKAIAIAQKYFSRSKFGKQIKIMAGTALDSIKQLSGPFDLIFIDADKTNYSNYYRAVLPKVRSGGVILVDNVLWAGNVLNPKTEDDHAIVEFNDLVSKDRNVDKVLVTIRDGIFLIRKK